MDQTTELLSSYACGLTYEDLSPQVVHQAKRKLVDTLGCGMGGFHSEPAQIARRLAANITSTVPSRILYTKGYSSSDMAGFANGVMVRYLDYNDGYISSGYGHPSDMIPGVLALAGPLGSDGREIITSIVLAYEVYCRLFDQVRPDERRNRGWDYGIFSGLGVACAAGRIMGLGPEQMGHAISLAVVPNLPLHNAGVGELTMWKGCRGPSASRAAIFAAQLAQQGMTGPFEPFDGRRGLWEYALGRPVHLDRFGGRGEPFRINDTLLKFFPSQGITQGPIGLALELRSQVALAEIEAIRVYTHGSAVKGHGADPPRWDPKTRETADHSIPYVVVMAFQDGAVTLATFSPQRFRDPALRPLMARVSIVEDPEFTRRFPAESNFRLEVTTRSGRQLVAATSYPKGHPRNPLSDAEVEAKFRSLSAGMLNDQRCDRALKLLWSLEDLPNLEELFDTVVV